MNKEDRFTPWKSSGAQPPKALQPKMAGPSQPARVLQLKPQPVAPPVYRPQPTPKVLQKKMAASQPQMNDPQLKQRQPQAPPVYRPQPVPKALQKKAAGNPQTHQRGLEHRPAAPPVLRPQPAPKSSQPNQHAVAQMKARSTLQRVGAQLAGGSGKMRTGYKQVAGEARNRAARGHSVVQCVLEETDERGYFTDSRDTNDPPNVFEAIGNNRYREMYSDAIYTYYPQTHQFQASDGTYYDPYYRIYFTYSLVTNCYHDTQHRLYDYDGTYYRPRQAQPQVVMQQQHQQQVSVPQQQQQQSQVLTNFNNTPSSTSSTQTTTPSASVAVNNNNSSSSSSSAPVVKNNDYFRQLVNSGGMGKSIGQTLSQQNSLGGTLDTLEQYALQSDSNLEEALQLLAGASHQRGVKGLKLRLNDAVSLNATDSGHAYAQYATYMLFVKLLQLYKGNKLGEYLLLQAECKKRDFDKKPPKGGGNGGGGRGSNFKTRQSTRLIM